MRFEFLHKEFSFVQFMFICHVLGRTDQRWLIFKSFGIGVGGFGASANTFARKKNKGIL